MQFSANSFTKFIPNYQMNNSPKINNNYELEIKKLKEELNREKINNKILQERNKKLNDMINNLKTNNHNLKNQIKISEIQLNKLKLELQNYKSNNEMNISNSNIFDLIRPLSPGEKIMTVIFNTLGTQLVSNWGLSCKKINLFVRLEEILNNNFPELKKHDIYFEVNGRRIKRYLTLEENKIKNNDLINIFVIDE